MESINLIRTRRNTSNSCSTNFAFSSKWVWLSLINKQSVTLFTQFFLLAYQLLYQSSLQSGLATDQFVHVVVA